jgi:hypothetical protein
MSSNQNANTFEADQEDFGADIVEENFGEDGEDDEIDLEVVDDTPEEDRGKPKPTEAALDDQASDDEIRNYSKRAQDRIRQLNWQRHEERRKREALERENKAAVDYARKAYEENQKLLSELTSGEERLIETSKSAAEAKLKAGNAAFKEAFESGDSEKIAEAQALIAAAQYELGRAADYSPRFKKPEDQPQPHTPQNTQPTQPAPQRGDQPRPDPIAEEWLMENQWFGNNHLMTKYAEALHSEVVLERGIDPISNARKYWNAIDEGMKKRFPEEFGGDAGGDQETASRGRRPAVAGASRQGPGSSSKRDKKRVVLTASEVALCKKMGITPQQYAKEKMKLQNKDL